MKTNKTFEIKLVKPPIWRDIIDRTFNGLRPRVEPTARSILRTMHNRHIGITPKLAAELAPLIVDASTSRHRGSTWGHVLDRLMEESSGGLRSVGMLLSTMPLYSILRLAMPIVEEACCRVRMCCLFCQDEIESDVTAEDYSKYSNLLDNEIRQMAIAKNEGDFFQAFWKDRGLTLTSYSRRAPVEGHLSPGLAETDPSALGLLLRLKPVLAKTKQLSLHPKPMIDPVKHREVSKIKEGGISGIFVTRRQEDMGDILLSEFINPPAVLADRLMNNGYFALRRQTKREQLRDVLIVGLMPEDVKPKLAADFVKACWFDFIARFGVMLVRSRMVRSEFRWLEGDAFGRVRKCDFLLQDLPFLETPTGMDIDIQGEGGITSSFRREFLMSLGWLPGYLDTRRRFETVPKYLGSPQQFRVTGETGTEDARRWAYSVWRAQKENLLWSIHEADESFSHSPGISEKQLDIRGFSFVHLMLFLPADKRLGKEASAASRLGSLYSGFGIGSTSTGSGSKHSASITWVPKNVRTSNLWAFECRGKRDSMIFPQEKPEWKSDKIAGRLEEAWRDQLLKELRNG